MLRAVPADVVVLHLAPFTHGAAASVRAVAAARPKVRVIALALKPTPSLVRELLDAGASACLTKDSAGAELLEAIQAVVAGRVYLSPALVGDVISDWTHPAGNAGGRGERPLAPREEEVLRRIAAGQTTKEIAFELHVSAKTVETHRRRIMAKLDCYSVAELTKYAVVRGLTPLSVPA